MGIWNRISTIVKSNINDLIEKAEDPEKMLEQLIMDMNENMIQLKQEVAKAIADEKNLEKYVQKSKTNAQGWEKRATEAVEKGDDNLATEALKRQTSEESLAQQYEQQWTAQKDSVDKLRTALQQLNDKIQEAQRKKTLLIARSKRAEVQTRINKTMSGLTDSSAFDGFARLEKKIEEKESTADAETQLNSELSGQDLENKFKALETNSNVSDKLAALKAKMGKN